MASITPDRRHKSPSPAKSYADDEDMEAQKLFQNQYAHPVTFFFHKSFKSKHTRIEYRKLIEENGGHVAESDSDVDVVIVDPRNAILPRDIKNIQLRYSCSEDPKLKKVLVEPVGWLRRCIKDRRYNHIIPQKESMPGRRSGSRTGFTREDKDHLCRYIASRVPYKARGGRTGNRIYIELENLLEIGGDEGEEYQWVKRHPWSSWREHYKVNQSKLDPIIDNMVAELPPNPRGIDPRDRSFRPSRVSGRKTIQMGHWDDEGEDGNMEVLLTEEYEEGEQERERRQEGVRGTGEPEHQGVGGEVESQKRRQSLREDISGRQQNSPTVEQMAKRVRVSQSEANQQLEKGKARQVHPNSENVEMVEDHNSLFSLDDDNLSADEFQPPSESGPSFTQHTPPPTQIPRSSQITLIDPTQVPASPERRPTATRTSPPQRVLRPRPGTVIELQRPVKGNPTKQGRRNKSKQPSVQVAPPTMRTDDAAPYRNTRARSKSVQPLAVQPTVAMKLKRKAKRPPALLPTMEDAIEEQVEPVKTETDDRSGAVGETFEERDVEALLIEDNPSMVLRRDEERAQSLDPDDQLIAEEMQRRSQPTRDVVEAASSDLAADDDDDDLAELLAIAKGRKKPKSAVSPSLPLPATKAETFTPGRPHPLRGRSSSSVSSDYFPSPGTRARKMKEEIQVKEKSTPYQPPAGTRAARVVSGGAHF